MATTDIAIETCKKLFRDNYKGNNIDEALLILRQAGASQAYTTLVLVDELKLSLKDADHIVLNSPVWEDHKAGSENFRDAFYKVLKRSE